VRGQEGVQDERPGRGRMRGQEGPKSNRRRFKTGLLGFGLLGRYTSFSTWEASVLVKSPLRKRRARVPQNGQEVRPVWIFVSPPRQAHTLLIRNVGQKKEPSHSLSHRHCVTASSSRGGMFSFQLPIVSYSCVFMDNGLLCFAASFVSRTAPISLPMGRSFPKIQNALKFRFYPCPDA
jgi:hypothetical protein